MATTTRTHGRCAVEECINPTRRDAIGANAGCWHLVHGNVYAEERRTFVVHSWAEACDEHRPTVAAAVRSDVEDWRDRWTVEVHTLDYGTPEAGGAEQVAQGIGTPAEDGRLF